MLAPSRVGGSGGILPDNVKFIDYRLLQAYELHQQGRSLNVWGRSLGVWGGSFCLPPFPLDKTLARVTLCFQPLNVLTLKVVPV